MNASTIACRLWLVKMPSPVILTQIYVQVLLENRTGNHLFLHCSLSDCCTPEIAPGVGRITYSLFNFLLLFPNSGTWMGRIYYWKFMINNIRHFIPFFFFLQFIYSYIFGLQKLSVDWAVSTHFFALKFLSFTKEMMLRTLYYLFFPPLLHWYCFLLKNRSFKWWYF